MGVALALSGCTDDPTDPPASVDGGPWTSGVTLTADPNQPGDPERGWYSLLHDGYMSCGVPYKLWENELASRVVKGALGIPDDAAVIPGRQGRNADLPYMMNAFTTTDGVEVVNSNCLQCHGGYFNGELVVGLGNVALDFTEDTGAEGAGAISDDLLTSFGLDAAEVAQFQKLASRVAVLGPETRMRTVTTPPRRWRSS